MKKQLFLGAVLLLLVPLMISSAVVVVGLNDHVHFDYDGMVANDFHIQGTVHSGGGIPPKVIETMIYGDIGTGNWYVNGICLQQIGPEDWLFELDFVTDGQITFCQWIHFGIKFNVEAKNIIADLIGWWTLDRNPLVSKMSASGKQGKLSGVNGVEEYLQAAVTGFDVTGDGANKVLTVMNDTNLAVEVRTLELAVSNVEATLAQMGPEGIGRPGEPSHQFPELVWKIIGGFPSIIEPGQKITIDLASIGIIMQPGQFLFMRGEQIMPGTKEPSSPKNLSAVRNMGDWGWFWEQHGE